MDEEPLRLALNSTWLSGLDARLVIVAESVAAVTLFLLRGRVAWALALLTFTTLGAFSIYLLASGISCGCFAGYGPKVLPAIVNFGAIVGLLAVRNQALAIREPNFKTVMLMSSLFCVAASVAVFLGPRPTTLGRPIWESSQDVVGKSIDELLPDAAAFIEEQRADALLLLNPGCERCLMALEEARSDHRIGESIVEVWIGPDGWELVGPSRDSHWVKWSPGTEPWVSAPVALRIDSGRVAGFLKDEGGRMMDENGE